MNLLELNEIVSGKYKESIKSGQAEKNRLAAESDVTLFKEALAINKEYQRGFNITDSAKEFYESYELFNSIFDDCIKEDVFYANKLGYLFEGVPCKLTYILTKSIRANQTPNLALQSVSSLVWGRFLKNGTLREGITIKEILENIYGKNIVLLSEGVRKVKYDDFSEVYVENVDRIVLLPPDIADTLGSIEDLKSIVYKKGLGVCFDSVPLRVYNGRIGIVEDEFDLRDAK